MNWETGWASRYDDTRTSDSNRIKIALVNNMPPAAFSATTNQFSRLLKSAAGDIPIAFDVFVLPDDARAGVEHRRSTSRTPTTDDLKNAGADAVIVTGCEPVRRKLQDESYWPRLSDLATWAENNTRATLWSCLATHAAVLNSCGIERRLLPAKQSGVYACEIISDHWLTAGIESPVRVPHSRLNDLSEDELRSHGFEILTRSSAVGVDAFVKETRQNLAVYLQGHPEYEERSLLLEFRRDLNRWIRGVTEFPPGIPENYFNPAHEATLAAAMGVAAKTRDFDALLQLTGSSLGLAAADWRPWSVTLLGNWLRWIAGRKHESASSAKWAEAATPTLPGA